jgi:hypothetical protein
MENAVDIGVDVDVDVDVDNLHDKIKNIEINIIQINEKIDKILATLEIDVKKMSNHIDFVEQVYDNMKHPLHFVMNQVSNIISYDNKKIDNKNKDDDK